MNKINFFGDKTYNFIVLLDDKEIYKGVFNEKSWNKSIENRSLWEFKEGRVLEKKINDLIIDFENATLENGTIKLKAISQQNTDNQNANNQIKEKNNEFFFNEKNSNFEIDSTLQKLEKIIKERKEKLPENSYTTLLFTKGEEKILKKLGEETIELILAKNSEKEIIYETADLIYHIMVYLVYKNIDFTEILKELENRMK